MLSDWLDDHFIPAVVFVMATLVLIVVYAGYMDYKNMKRLEAECISREGKWIVTGYHWTTTYVQSGNIMVPIENKTYEYGCTR